MAYEEEFNEQENFESESPLSEEDSSHSDRSAASEDEKMDYLEPSSSEADAAEPFDVGKIDTQEHDDGRAWYVIHCYSGYEKKVRYNLEQRIESMGMRDKIFDVVIPTQEEIEVREGKRRSIERHVFPGYVLVNMILTEETWFVVRNTPGVTGFVGMGNDPTPLRPEEVQHILKRMEAEAPHVKFTFREGERVRIIDGPFNDFHGHVSEIDVDRAKVVVMVNFFGRETPVELDFLQVEKA
jgi:transcriptional antiterminator NusG